MTLDEKIIVSTYTGYMMCDFSLVHAYIQKILGRPVWTDELNNGDILDEIGRRTKPEFLKICADEEVHVDLEELKIDR